MMTKNMVGEYASIANAFSVQMPITTALKVIEFLDNSEELPDIQLRESLVNALNSSKEFGRCDVCKCFRHRNELHEYDRNKISSIVQSVLGANEQKRASAKIRLFCSPECFEIKVNRLERAVKDLLNPPQSTASKMLDSICAEPDTNTDNSAQDAQNEIEQELAEEKIEPTPTPEEISQNEAALRDAQILAGEQLEIASERVELMTTIELANELRLNRSTPERAKISWFDENEPIEISQYHYRKLLIQQLKKRGWMPEMKRNS